MALSRQAKTKIRHDIWINVDEQILQSDLINGDHEHNTLSGYVLQQRIRYARKVILRIRPPSPAPGAPR